MIHGPTGPTPRKQGTDVGAWYATRGSVKTRLDVKETARANALVDDAIETASRIVESPRICDRIFYPSYGVRYFDWPDTNSPTSWRLWLGENELVAASALTAGGVTIAATDYFLGPANLGPPFDRIDIDLASAAAFASGDTWQRAIAVTGAPWGFWDTWIARSTLAEALDSSEIGVDITAAPYAWLDVGSILKVDSEIMLATERSALDSGQNTTGALTASTSDVAIGVADGTAFVAGEVLAVDSERVLVESISANTLTVKRAWDGSVLAAHSSNADVFAYRTLTVERGALGTTAAAHSLAAPVSVFVVPGPVATLTRTMAMDILLQDQSGWARTVGSGESQMAAPGGAIDKMIKRVRASHGRRARTYAV